MFVNGCLNEFIELIKISCRILIVVLYKTPLFNKCLYLNFLKLKLWVKMHYAYNT